MPGTNNFLSLSASKLALLGGKDACPCCFWLANQDKATRIEQPEGIVASITNGFDRVLKAYGDRFRGSLPPELHGKIPGVLWGSVEQINKIRHWKSGLQARLQFGPLTVSIIGALDELIYNPESRLFAPADYKSKGAAIKDDGSQYYQVQSNVYDLLLTENEMPTMGHAFYIYVWPEKMDLGFEGLSLDFQVCELESKADRARDLIAKAVEILAGPKPESRQTCKYCTYVQARTR